MKRKAKEINVYGGACVFVCVFVCVSVCVFGLVTEGEGRIKCHVRICLFLGPYQSSGQPIIE